MTLLLLVTKTARENVKSETDFLVESDMKDLTTRKRVKANNRCNAQRKMFTMMPNICPGRHQT